ncbi:hypothetical protein [Microcoleus sp.]|uniref:hypothetical protein n=1 Tax=Microcoleus sp. TaxID=44472 RepID=UPI003593D17A
MNILTLGNDDLVPVDYGDLLDKILETLQAKNPFSVSEDSRRLLIDIDTIAADVAQKEVRKPLGSFEREADSATVNFPPEVEENFGSQVRQVRDCLRQHLEFKLPQNTSIERFVANLISPLDSRSFQGNGPELGFKYDFGTRHPLEKEKLTLQSLGSGSHATLKLHKLTIAVRNTDIFEQELKQGLQNYINENAETSSEKEDLNHRLDEMVKNPDSDFYKLIRLVDKETLGKIHKEAQIIYLDYLLEHIRASNNTDAVGIIYLEDLIRRLRLIEAYINDPNKSDGDYEVNYGGIRVNYREIFARAEVLNSLPIIPIVEGYLGESTDNSRNERKFVSGLKIKFDNPVQARGGKEVFEYYLNLLNPDSEEHKSEFEEYSNPETFVRKVLKLALLYYFVFASRSNPLAPNYDPQSEFNYQPIPIFEQKVLPILQGSDDEEKKELFRNFIKGFNQFNIKHKITHLKRMLKGFLEQRTILPIRTETRHVNLKMGLVEDIENILATPNNFFNDIMERNYKQTLHYITVKEPSVDERSICQLPVNIIIEDVRYFPTDERQNFSMEYNIKGVNFLPVASVPESRMSAYNDSFKQYKLLLFRYNNRRLDSGDKGLQPAAAFVYKFTMLLLSYICMKILLENTADNLFIPMVRLHEGDKKHRSPSEEFMADLSKTLSHILSEKQRSTSQGFRIGEKKVDTFRVRNGLSSMYSILPKKFRFDDDVQLAPELDKLAIIVVSSRDSDAKRGNQNRFQRQASLIGEVVGINRIDDTTIQVEMLKTLSENYSVSRLYSEPLILEDVMSQLYQQGYRNFAYISQAPYMSRLHITKTEEDEELSFMSKKLLRTLKGERRDIKIYPMFFDKYYVRSFLGDNGKSFYIQDAMELENLFADTSQQAVMFFNLFNGIKVKQSGQKNFYNGVISYSTLLNIYQGILDDQDIREGLIYDGAIKNTLLHYLTIFHFSRYEARQNISLKLDPYERIIGDKSVGALSIFSHAGGSVEFNSLAFLNKVREVLNVGDGGTQS